MAEPRLRVRWKRAHRRFTFLAVRSLLRAAGFDRARPIGRALGVLQFHLDRRRRRRVQADMAATLGRPATDRSVAALLREAYRVNAAAMLEIMAMFDRRQDEGALAARCAVDGTEHVRAALGAGRGAILLPAHMGNVALLTLLFARAGWPVSVVYKEARMMSAGFFQEGFERYGIQGILANTGLRAYGQMLGALKQGRILFVMLDQGVKRAEDGLVQRFLGKDVPMPPGPAQLARVSRAPVLPVLTTAADPVWRFEIGPPVPLGADPLEADVARLVGVTERQVLQHPQLWSWPYRRWRKYPRAG